MRPSACRDEVVVYRITCGASQDSVIVDARKMMRGEEEEMGTLTCRLLTAAPAVVLRRPMRHSLWRFRVRGDSLFGELRLLNSTKCRDVRAARGR